MKVIRLILIFIVIAVGLNAKDTISVFVEQNENINKKLLIKLNQQSNQYRFVLKKVSQNRLNYILEPWINNTCREYREGRCFKNWVLVVPKKEKIKLNSDKFLSIKVHQDKINNIITNTSNKKLASYLKRLDI